MSAGQKHDVTVYDRVPATASVSVAQVRTYIARTGWTVVRSREDGDVWFDEYGSHVVLSSTADAIKSTVDAIAAREARQPSSVLADIAREPK